MKLSGYPNLQRIGQKPQSSLYRTVRCTAVTVTLGRTSVWVTGQTTWQRGVPRAAVTYEHLIYSCFKLFWQTKWSILPPGRFRPMVVELRPNYVFYLVSCCFFGVIPHKICCRLVHSTYLIKTISKFKCTKKTIMTECWKYAAKQPYQRMKDILWCSEDLRGWRGFWRRDSENKIWLQFHPSEWQMSL